MNLACSQNSYRFARLALLLSIVMLAACTNSHLVVSTLYDRLDDQIRGEYNKLGKFTDAQKDEFEAVLQTFHYWHRRNELPKYAQMLRQIRTSVASKNNTTSAEIAHWFKSVENYADSAQACYPVHFTVDMMKALRNEQVDFIQNRFARERQKNRSKYRSKTREERMQQRLDNIVKWTSRAGLELTRKQQRMILSTMHETRSLRDEYYALTDAWNRRTFATLRARQQPAFKFEMKNQLNSLYELMQTNYPQEIEANRKIWREFSLEFIDSLTNNQRVWVAVWLKKMAKNLDRIALKDVKFKPHTDDTLGCLTDSKS